MKTLAFLCTLSLLISCNHKNDSQQDTIIYGSISQPKDTVLYIKKDSLRKQVKISEQGFFQDTLSAGSKNL